MVVSSILLSERGKDTRYALSTESWNYPSLFVPRYRAHLPENSKLFPGRTRSEIRFSAIKTNGLVDSLCESRTIFLSALPQIERDK